MRKFVLLIPALILLNGCFASVSHYGGTARVLDQNGVPCFALKDSGFKDWTVSFVQVARLDQGGQKGEILWVDGIDAPRPVINKKDCIAWRQAFENVDAQIHELPPPIEQLHSGLTYRVQMNTSPVGNDRSGRWYSGYFCLSESPSGGRMVHDLGMKKDACPVAQ